MHCDAQINEEGNEDKEKLRKHFSNAMLALIDLINYQYANFW